MVNREITVLNNLEELSRKAAEKFVELASTGGGIGHSFTVALAGGSTPKKLYELLADKNEPYRAKINWRRINFFWSDERCAAPDSNESNFRMANEFLLKPLGICPTNIHRFKSELAPEQAAADYERFLRLFFNVTDGSFPHFDLILLGLGVDGHTASLFSGTNVLGDSEKLVAAPFVEKFKTNRLTLTPAVINRAANVILQVSGDDKADALSEVLQGEYNPAQFPAQIINVSRGKVFWIVDEAAAQKLTVNRKYENFTGRLRR